MVKKKKQFKKQQQQKTQFIRTKTQSENSSGDA